MPAVDLLERRGGGRAVAGGFLAGFRSDFEGGAEVVGVAMGGNVAEGVAEVGGVAMGVEVVGVSFISL